MQSNDQTNYAQKLEHIKILLSYKVFRCPRVNCPFEKQSSPLQSNSCEFYHGESDQRRFPFVESMLYFQKNDSLLKKFQDNVNYGLDDFFHETAGKTDDGSQKKIRLAYSNALAGPPYQEKECLNLEELSFHPLNYKSNQCADLQDCRARFCPRYHSNEEGVDFKKLRECFEDLHSTLKQEKSSPVKKDHFEMLISHFPSKAVRTIESKVAMATPMTNNQPEKTQETVPVELKIESDLKQKNKPVQIPNKTSSRINWRNLDTNGNYELEPHQEVDLASQNNQKPLENIIRPNGPSQYKVI